MEHASLHHSYTLISNEVASRLRCEQLLLKQLQASTQMVSCTK